MILIFQQTTFRTWKFKHIVPGWLKHSNVYYYNDNVRFGYDEFRYRKTMKYNRRTFRKHMHATSNKTTWKWRNTTADMYFRFDQERQICLFVSIFVFFSPRLLISSDISIRRQDMGKKKLPKPAKIVSEQLKVIWGRKRGILLKRWTLSHFTEKYKSSRKFFEVKTYSCGWFNPICELFSIIQRGSDYSGWKLIVYISRIEYRSSFHWLEYINSCLFVRFLFMSNFNYIFRFCVLKYIIW